MIISWLLKHLVQIRVESNNASLKFELMKKSIIMFLSKEEKSNLYLNCRESLVGEKR